VIYREYRPSPPLRDLVDRLWWLEGPAELIGAEPIPPDGRTEIIVHGGDPFEQADGAAGWQVQNRVLFAAQATRAVRVRPRGLARIAGARLQPTGAHAFFGCPQAELANRIVELHVIDSRLARALGDDVASRENGEAMVAALDRALVRAAPASAARSPATDAVGIALARRGLIRVANLAAELDLSARQIERLFRDRVGLPPKLFLRIVRFQEVLGSLRSGPASSSRPWAEIAARHGFYDQAHFIRDFKAFTDQSPGASNIGPESLAAVFSAVGRRRELSA
jgi:AraC-like DNA-binding protein